MAASLRVIGSAFRLGQEHAAARIVAPADAREWATDSVVDTGNHTSRAFIAVFRADDDSVRASAGCAPVRGVTYRQSAASRAELFPWQMGNRL